MFEPFAERAPAKINLALHVLGRRPDGYHELDSIVAFADFGDELRFSPADRFTLTASGPFAANLPPQSENIIARAWTLANDIASARGGKLPPVAVHLAKNLPVASGIGGGSSDAAAALRGFLRIGGSGSIDDDTMARALPLGADVPSCLLGRACRMQGVGERVTPLRGFRPLKVLLVNPGVELRTKDVFGALRLQSGVDHRRPIADFEDAAAWRNDLTAAAQTLAPVISDVLASLKRQPGVRHAGMSGSGATCWAAFEGERPTVDPAWWQALAVLR